MELSFSKAKYHIDGDGFWLSINIDQKDGQALLDEIKPETKYTAEIVKYREKRSLNANAYFHLLVHKIAEKMNIGDDEEKIRLVLEYGAIAKDNFGNIIGFKLPEHVDVRAYYKYAKVYGFEKVKGILWTQYIAYKETHLYDSKEMARLIDGAVFEAKEMGIETLMPEQLENLKSLWRQNAQEDKSDVNSNAG